MPEDRLRKLNDENKTLATHLRNEFMALQKPPKTSISAATKKRTAGSDLSSTRGSEERHASLPATGRGQKRGRDNDIEKASDPLSLDQRRSSSRKRRKTTKAEALSPVPPRKSKAKAKADPAPNHPKEDADGKASMPLLEVEKLSSPHHLLENTSGRKSASPSASSTELSAPAEETPSSEGFTLDDSEVKSSKPPSAPQKSSIDHDSGDSTLSFLRESPKDPDPGDAIRRKQGLAACQNSRKERADARQAREAGDLRPTGALIALYKDQPRGTKITVAGIPIDNTPADLVSFVKKKRQRVKAIGNKIKFTDRRTPQQEETFNLRPAIHISIPDHLKSILVDDWENVTKNLSLVPLPSKPSANEILTSYFDEEKNKRHLGSPEADLLEEVVAGLKEYFEKCVGRILLYRFERQQYLEVYNAVQAGTGEYEGRTMGDIYGAEHLCRLFGKSLLLFVRCQHQSPITSYHTHTPFFLPDTQNQANNPPQSPSPNSSPKQTWTNNPSTVSAKNSTSSPSGSAKTPPASSRLRTKPPVRITLRRSAVFEEEEEEEEEGCVSDLG